MRFRLHLLTTIVLLGLTSVPLGARGADLVIVSNLNEPHSLYDTILPFTTGGSPGFAAAQEFKTGPNDYKLAQILVNLGNLDPGNNNEFTLSATLRADNNDVPSSVVLTEFSYDTKSIPTSGFANVAFNPASLLSLTSGTNYWFVLSSSSASGSVGWSFANTTGSSGPGTLPLFNNSTDGGATWHVPSFTPAPGAGPYLIQVNAVPEPTSYVLGIIGFGGVFLVTRSSSIRRRIG